ncbi:hypothetical protein MMC17_002838 [Xylographa soralifera]|nr:hypothetical protein [Xylographa soralifera]
MQFCQIVLSILSWVLVAAAFPSIDWVDCGQNVPIFFTLANVTVPTTNLPSNLSCGEIVVPMDYWRPISANNNITLSLAMYRPANPKGVIFYNGGGSDPNTVVAWEVALGARDTFDGLLDYDLMMMDTRGTWDSNPLNASDTGIAAVANILQPFPRNQSAFDAVRASSAAFIKDVEYWTTPPGIVQYISAREVAHDYEQIRIALGYEKVNFLGLSYGTYRATQYAASYPQRVGHFVLDAIAPHGTLPQYEAHTQIAALNRVLYRADAFCLNDSSCPFFGQGKGSVITAYKKILASAPLPALNCVADGGSPTCATTLTAFDIQLAVANDLESQGIDFPTLLESLNSSLQGDGSSFGGSAAVPSNLNIFTAGAVLLECGDNNYQYTTFAEWEKSLNKGLAHDPNQIAQSGTWQLQLSCLAWPYRTPPTEPLITDVPMLLVTSDFDGGLPTEWAEPAWSQARNSVLVVRHGDDHTTFSLSDQPSTAMMKEFLSTGTLPKAMSNSLVTVYTPGMERAPFPDPYSIPTGEMAGDVNCGNLTEAAILP